MDCSTVCKQRKRDLRNASSSNSIEAPGKTIALEAKLICDLVVAKSSYNYCNVTDFARADAREKQN